MIFDYGHDRSAPGWRKSRAGAALLTLLALPASGLCQAPAPTMAGSVNYTALALELTAGGGEALSAQYREQGAIGGPTTGILASSTNYSCEGGVVWSKPAYGGAPIVLGTEPAFGPTSGGNLTRVFGYNFAAPGASVPQIFFNGKIAAVIGPVLSNAVDVVAPAGKNAFGNPDNPVAIAAINNKGFTSSPGGYAYLPALFATGSFSPGGQIQLQLRTDTALSFVLFAFGGAVPGVGLPVFGIQGSLVVLFPLVLTSPQLLVGNELIFSNAIPADPSLNGIAIDIQSMVLTSLGSPPAGKFSNPVHVVIQS